MERNSYIIEYTFYVLMGFGVLLFIANFIQDFIDNRKKKNK